MSPRPLPPADERDRVHPIEPDPPPFAPGQPPPITLSLAGTPPCGFEFLGAKPTVRGWLLPCPCCVQGWCALLPSDADPHGYELAAEAGCSRGCSPEDIAWWQAWRLGELPSQVPREPDRQARRYLAGAVRHAARRIVEAQDPLAVLKREAFALGSLAAGTGADPAEIAHALGVAARHARLPAEPAARAIGAAVLAGTAQPRGMRT